MNSDNTITIPVQATMSRQVDGSWCMVDAKCVSVASDTVAQFFLEAFNISTVAEIYQ
jgi:hypothetical protein